MNDEGPQAGHGESSHHHHAQRHTAYNRYAGKSLERIGALSDGVFAIAMTLIVLEIRVPDIGNIHTEAELWQGLITLGPRFLTYLMSFLTLGIFWTGQQTQLYMCAHSDRDFTWIHFGFLAVVSLLPFSTTVLAEFMELRLALLLYWLNIVACGGVLFASWTYANRSGLVRPDAPAEVTRMMCRRILVAQALYTVGAALCVINTYWSIGFILAVKLNFAFAPKIKWLERF